MKHESKEFSERDSGSTLVGIQLHIVLSECIEGLLQVVQMFSLVQAFHQHVIHINFYISPNLRTKHVVDQSLVCCSNVFQSKRHYFITK